MSNDIHLLLLIKSASGPLAPAEAEALSAWLQDPANARTADEYLAIWEKSAGYQPEMAIDTEADFRKVMARIQTQEAQPAVRRNTWWRVAAAVLVLVAAVGIYRYSTGSTPEMLVAEAGSDMREVQLPDGTQVWLRQYAWLEYPAQFSADVREVHLSGEALFDVEHAESHPFRVDLQNGGKVEVLGTRFNIRQSDAEASVLVQRGKVRFQPVSGDEGVVLTAGKRAAFDQQDRRITLSQAYTYNELSWQTGGLEFIDAPLSEVVKDLNTYYHVNISLENQALSGCTLTAPLSSQPLDQLLESLSLTYQIKVVQTTPGNYVLKGEFVRIKQACV